MMTKNKLYVSLVMVAGLLMTNCGSVTASDLGISENQQQGRSSNGMNLGLAADDSISQPDGDTTAARQCLSEQRHTAVLAAIQNRDFDAWVAAMQLSGRSPRVLDYVTKENFARFAEAHDLAVAGKTDEANAIRAELGLQGSPRSGFNRTGECPIQGKMGQGGKQGRGQHGQGGFGMGQ